MAHKDFVKNSREAVRITPSRFQGYDLIDIRIFAKNKQGEIVATRKGVSLNVDQIPDLVECLEWALQQSCREDTDRIEEPLLNRSDADALAREAHSKLIQHGLPVHWDIAERIVLSAPNMSRFNKWQLHYVLATRRDLFRKEDTGCFRALEGGCS